MLRTMTKSALLSLVALSIVFLAGCPEKKEEPAPSKPAAAAPANAPAPSANAPKPGGGGW
jgi:hypothetical protein